MFFCGPGGERSGVEGYRAGFAGRGKARNHSGIKTDRLYLALSAPLRDALTQSCPVEIEAVSVQVHSLISQIPKVEEFRSPTLRLRL